MLARHPPMGVPALTPPAGEGVARPELAVLMLMGVRGAPTVPRLSRLFDKEDEALMEDDRDGVGRRLGVTMDEEEETPAPPNDETVLLRETNMFATGEVDTGDCA